MGHRALSKEPAGLVCGRLPPAPFNNRGLAAGLLPYLVLRELASQGNFVFQGFVSKDSGSGISFRGRFTKHTGPRCATVASAAGARPSTGGRRRRAAIPGPLAAGTARRRARSCQPVERLVSPRACAKIGFQKSLPSRGGTDALTGLGLPNSRDRDLLSVPVMPGFRCPIAVKRLQGRR
jgi:hypothetical protein